MSARLYVTALGSYRVFLNGRKVGADVLSPDFTEYRKRVLYQAYDVTGSLVSGNNVNQRAAGRRLVRQRTHLGWNAFFSPPDRFVAQLEIDTPTAAMTSS